MHEADWVHRDVSAGNVYWYEDGEGERGLLADFEYAKKMKKKCRRTRSDNGESRSTYCNAEY